MVDADADEKPVVAVDLDGFLWDFYVEIAFWHDRTYGTDLARLVHTQWRSVWLEENWGGTGPEAGDKVVAFYRQLDFRAQEPMDGAIEAMRQLAMKYELVLVTSNAHLDFHDILAWLDTWFPGMFRREVVRTGTFQSDIGALQRIGAACKLEDRLDRAQSVAAAGIWAVVVEHYLWSYGPNPPHLRHAKRLADVPAAVDLALTA
jgi:hypothetical protein